MHRPPQPGFQMHVGPPHHPGPGPGPGYGPGLEQAPVFQQPPPGPQMGQPGFGPPPGPHCHGPQDWPSGPPPFQAGPGFHPPPPHMGPPAPPFNQPNPPYTPYPQPQSSQPFQNRPPFQPPPNQFGGQPWPPQQPPVSSFHHHQPPGGPGPGPGPMSAPQPGMPHGPGPSSSVYQGHSQTQASAQYSDKRTRQDRSADSSRKVLHRDIVSSLSDRPKWSDAVGRLIDVLQEDKASHSDYQIERRRHDSRGRSPNRRDDSRDRRGRDTRSRSRSPRQERRRGRDSDRGRSPTRRGDAGSQRSGQRSRSPLRHQSRSSSRSDISEQRSSRGSPGRGDNATHDRHGNRRSPDRRESLDRHGNKKSIGGHGDRSLDRHGNKRSIAGDGDRSLDRHGNKRSVGGYGNDNKRSPDRHGDSSLDRYGNKRSFGHHDDRRSVDSNDNKRSPDRHDDRSLDRYGNMRSFDRHGNVRSIYLHSDRRSPDRRGHERRSRSPSEGKRRREQSPRESSSSSSSRRDDLKRPRAESGRESPPPKPRHRWDELEEALEAERRANEPSPEPFEDIEDFESDDTPWIQCSPRENFYSVDTKDQMNSSTVAASEKLKDLLARFEHDIVERGPRTRASQPEPEQKQAKLHRHVHTHEHSDCSGSESSSDTDSSSDDSDNEEDNERMICMQNRENHPWRLAENLWFNEPGEMNDGPLCKCSLKQQKSGIRHNIYPGEEPIPVCDPFTNNAGRLHHYRITISPTTNFLSSTQTVIVYDKREYIFEGFSLFSHESLDEVPECKVMRFGREYTLHFFSEPMPENFTVQGLDLFAVFLFEEILELYDFDFKGHKDGCQHFHFMPRFARLLPNNGKEILSMHHVIQYLIKSSKPIVDPAKLPEWLTVSEITWQKHADRMKNMIATRPGKKPSSIRIDQLDREQMDPTKVTFPVIVHFGVRPAQLSYIGDPKYRKLHKSYLRLRHLLFNRPRVTRADRSKLADKEEKLQKLRLQGNRVREVTAEVSSEHMLGTGIGVDICQHAMMLPVLVNHLRYFACLTNLYKVLDYKFADPMMLKHAMTHPSFKQNYGTNPDHVRNSLYNCGTRQLEYVAHKKQLEKERKKGINQLYKIMSLMATEDEIPSHIKTYERLEFLGDAVIEFLSSTHLYYLFPNLEEGGLATYRVALVQNQHLSVLAKKLELDRYMLYAHGPDLCRPYDLRHAMANCFEAVMGALYLEAGLDHAKKIFGQLLFEEQHLQGIWFSHPKDPLQIDFPEGDRHMIDSSAILKKLTAFEEATGIKFKHIRLLARSFTQRTVGYTHLTRGSNQRLEFLGDSVLQLVVSTYLYKHFPDHHEGHLSLLRSSLVNNRTQSIVAADLGMEDYIIDTETRKRSNDNIPMKIMADLLEALIGAMYVDHGLDAVETFCGVLFFPRLKDFIETQDWNDAKSQLQQCCLTLRMEGQEPDVPSYKVISQSGPTNSRQYSVAVYFKGKRMATGTASNIQDAQMEAAKNALKKANFPHLWYQRKCVMAKRQGDEDGSNEESKPGGGGERGPRDASEDSRRERKGSPQRGRDDRRDYRSGRRDEGRDYRSGRRDDSRGRQSEGRERRHGRRDDEAGGRDRSRRPDHRSESRDSRGRSQSKDHRGRNESRDSTGRSESRDSRDRRESRDSRDGNESRDPRDRSESQDPRDRSKSRDQRDRNERDSSGRSDRKDPGEKSINPPSVDKDPVERTSRKSKKDGEDDKGDRMSSEESTRTKSRDDTEDGGHRNESEKQERDKDQESGVKDKKTDQNEEDQVQDQDQNLEKDNEESKNLDKEDAESKNVGKDDTESKNLEKDDTESNSAAPIEEKTEDVDSNAKDVSERDGR